MITHDLIDELDKLIGSVYANASTINSEEIKEKMENANQLLIKIRKCILAEFEYDRSNQF
jgi:hypothetical protein